MLNYKGSEVMRFTPQWIMSAERASRRDKRYGNKTLRFCPGVYLPTGEYFDVWLKCWLETTPYKDFEELWASNKVVFACQWEGLYENNDIEEDFSDIPRDY